MAPGASAPASAAASAAQSSPDWLQALAANGWPDYNESWIVALLLSLLVLFWVVGAYNRLAGLRNDLSASWTKVQQALQARAGAVGPLLAALRAPMATEHGALDALLVSHAEAQRVAALMSAAPGAAEQAKAWVAAEAALAAAGARVQALLAHDTALREQAGVAAALNDWTAAEQRLPFVRQLFNESAGQYNQALAQFPTRMVARAFGFKPAGLI